MDSYTKLPITFIYKHIPFQLYDLAISTECSNVPKVILLAKLKSLQLVTQLHNKISQWSCVNEINVTKSLLLISF